MNARRTILAIALSFATAASAQVFVVDTIKVAGDVAVVAGPPASALHQPAKPPVSFQMFGHGDNAIDLLRVEFDGSLTMGPRATINFSGASTTTLPLPEGTAPAMYAVVRVDGSAYLLPLYAIPVPASAATARVESLQ